MSDSLHRFSRIYSFCYPFIPLSVLGFKIGFKNWVQELTFIINLLLTFIYFCFIIIPTWKFRIVPRSISDPSQQKEGMEVQNETEPAENQQHKQENMPHTQTYFYRIQYRHDIGAIRNRYFTVFRNRDEILFYRRL